MHVARYLTCLTTTFVITASVRLFRPSNTLFIVEACACFRRTFQLSPTSDRRAIKKATFREFTRVRVVTMFNNFFLFTFRRFKNSSDLSKGLITRLITNTLIFTRLFNCSITHTFRHVLFIFRVSFRGDKRATIRVIFTLRWRWNNGQFRSFLPYHFNTNFAFQLVKRVCIFRFNNVPALFGTFTRFFYRFTLFFCNEGGDFFSLNRFARLIVSIFGFTCLCFIRSSNYLFPMSTCRESNDSPIR